MLSLTRFNLAKTLNETISHFSGELLFRYFPAFCVLDSRFSFIKAFPDSGAI